MGFKLESLHLYRKVPRDLTDATSVGGAISLVCAMVMAYLFVSNINDYLKMQTTTDVALDDTGEVSMRIFFNITMVRRGRAAWASVRGARMGVGGGCACMSGCLARHLTPRHGMVVPCAGAAA